MFTTDIYEGLRSESNEDLIGLIIRKKGVVVVVGWGLGEQLNYLSVCAS